VSDLLAAAFRDLTGDAALLDRHDRGHALDRFSIYRDRPAEFIRRVLKGKSWQAQVHLAELVRLRPLVAVKSCHAAGKDWLAAALALWWAVARQGMVLVTGPTTRQVRQVVFGEIRRFFAHAPRLPGELYESELRLDRAGHAGIVGFTSRDSSRLGGFHAPSMLIIATEAQGLEPFAWDAIHGWATSADSRVLAVGNPLAPAGPFFDLFRSSDWETVTLSAFDTPNVQEKREVIPGMVTAEWVERMTRIWGEGSGTYASRVLGQFPDESEEMLCRRSWVRDAVVRHAEMPDEGQYVLGLDPARYGMDETIIAVRRGMKLVELKAYRGADLMETTGHVMRLRAELGTQNVQAIVVDEPGIGGGVIDRLVEQQVKVVAFNGGAASPDARYRNKRAWVFWLLRGLLERGEAGLPDDEKLADELCGIKWRTTSDGRIQLEPKDKLRVRIGRSCDRADAVALAFSAATLPDIGSLSLEGTTQENPFAEAPWAPSFGGGTGVRRDGDDAGLVVLNRIARPSQPKYPPREWPSFG
jgi:hypothetical protein